jgi:hypothetical protein
MLFQGWLPGQKKAVSRRDVLLDAVWLATGAAKARGGGPVAWLAAEWHTPKKNKKPGPSILEALGEISCAPRCSVVGVRPSHRRLAGLSSLACGWRRPRGLKTVSIITIM